MRKLLLILMVLTPSAALAGPQQLCVNGKGRLVVRSQCRRGHQALSVAALSIAGPQGPSGAEGAAGLQGPAGPRGETGPQGLPGVSDLQVSDSSIALGLASCIMDMNSPMMCMVPGYTLRQAACPAGTLLVKSWCVTKPKNGSVAAPTRTESADGTSVSCLWSNNNFAGIPGEYYARALCLPAPAL